MTSEAARLVVYLGSTVGFVVWLWGLMCVRAMLGDCAEPNLELTREKVDGTADEFLEQIASRLRFR